MHYNIHFHKTKPVFFFFFFVLFCFFFFLLYQRFLRDNIVSGRGDIGNSVFILSQVIIYFSVHIYANDENDEMQKYSFRSLFSDEIT